jgi:hypothetical protein
MAICAPVEVVVASFAVVLVVIKFAAMFLNPARVFMFYPAVFMVERQAILFNVFVADIAGYSLFSPLFVAWNACAEHIRNQVQRDCVAFCDACMALITLDIIFQMRLVGKFQVFIFFGNIMFNLYFHSRSCMAQQA